MSGRREWHDALAAEMVDRGQLIESGWVAMRAGADGYGLQPGTINAMRIAFLAGAQHLFASIMTILEPGNEPSEKDLQRMGLISAELEAVSNELVAWVNNSNRGKAMAPFKTGDRLLITFDEVTVAGVVRLASPNGQSLMLQFEALLGGYVGAMPVLGDDAGRYRDLIFGRPVMLKLTADVQGSVQ